MRRPPGLGRGHRPERRRFGDCRDVIRAARTYPRARGSLRAAPVSVAVLAATVLFTAADRVPGAVHRGVSELARYRAADLFAGRWWRLPLSGLLAQSPWQCLCTVVIGGALYVALEQTMGRALVLVLATSHMLPTLAIACFARAGGDTHLLTVLDFGTSCLLMGAAGALLWLRRSRLLLVGTGSIYAGDLVVNSPMTITEHVLALGCGVGVAIVWGGVPALHRARSARACDPDHRRETPAEPLPLAGIHNRDCDGGKDKQVHRPRPDTGPRIEDTAQTRRLDGGRFGAAARFALRSPKRSALPSLRSTD